ncbi:MAG TPA: hypothetical protein PKE69_18615 [Pyrinomonadaceae bacterium]|nr:hypothetical protein [Pyrinomonadaceae bacterium]
MEEEILFSISYLYNTLESGIVVPVAISDGESIVKFEAKIDTGSSFCVFQRIQGERLGLDIEGGTPLRMSTATAPFDTFGHRVNLSVLGIETESTVYFAAEDSFYLNILGRQGFLDRVKLGLIDYEGKLFLSAYGE